MILDKLIQIELYSLDLIKLISFILLICFITYISIYLIKNRNSIKSKNRNSLLELYRFVASILILGYHAYFYKISDKNLLGDCNLYLYFFFILSGYYMYQTIDKYKEGQLFKSLYRFIKDRLVSMGLPLLIVYIFTLATSILSINEEHMIHLILLWYIHIMLIIECLYLILFKLFKEKIINIISLSLILIGCLLKILIFTNILYISLSPYHEINGFIYIPIGYLIYKKEIKINLNKCISLILSVLCFFIPLIISIVYYQNITREILSLISCVFLILAFILSKDIKFNNKYINMLGKCSFYIYIYQMIIRFLETLFFIDNYINYEADKCFISANIIFSLTLITLILNLIKSKKISTNK